jgi:hypothetical protein
MGGKCAAADYTRRNPLSWPQQPLQLVKVEPVLAHFDAVQQQYRYVQPETTGQGRITVHVDDLGCRQSQPACGRQQLSQEFLAQAAVGPRQQLQP